MNLVDYKNLECGKFYAIYGKTRYKLVSENNLRIGELIYLNIKNNLSSSNVPSISITGYYYSFRKNEKFIEAQPISSEEWYNDVFLTSDQPIIFEVFELTHDEILNHIVAEKI